MHLRPFRVFPSILILASAAAVTNCAIQEDLQEAASGCDEFSAGGDAVANLNVDVKVKAFAQASSELKIVTDGIRLDVKQACVNIAKDLGETDRWSDKDDDASISNSQKTGACDVVAGRIDAIMTAGRLLGPTLRWPFPEVSVLLTLACKQIAKPPAKQTSPAPRQRSKRAVRQLS